MLIQASSAGPRSDARSNEQGSIVVSMSALLLLVLIGSALVARGQIVIRSAANEADAVIAEAAAEQGIAEVLARLEAGERGDFSDSGQTALASYSYAATAVSETEYLVRADGEVGDQSRSIDVTLGGEPAAAVGPTLFVDSRATITDNAGTISGLVATNGVISATGTTVGDAVDLHGPSAGCNNCGPATVHADSLDARPPTAPSGEVRTCPSSGQFTGVLDGRDGVPYVCNNGDVSASWVEFVGTITVINPPLQVYVEPGLDVRIRDASVNATGDVDDFQLFGIGDDDYWWMDTWNSTIRGTLYGPGRDSLLQYSSIVGSVSVGVLWISSPASVWIAPDGEVMPTESSGWTVTSFDRVPSR